MFSKILVAIDGSQFSKRVVPTAIEVAGKFKAEVYVLHVSEHDHGRAAVYTLETPADATRLVFDAVKTFQDAGIVAKGEVHNVAVGHVAKAIVEAAAGQKADLIVMGSRGLSDVQGLLLGSVTHKVMQMAHTAVLVDRGIPQRDLVAAGAEKSFSTR